MWLFSVRNYFLFHCHLSERLPSQVFYHDGFDLFVYQSCVILTVKSGNQMPFTEIAETGISLHIDAVWRLCVNCHNMQDYLCESMYCIVCLLYVPVVAKRSTVVVLLNIAVNYHHVQYCT